MIMSKCKMHNVRFYKPQPKAVHCMSLETETNRLAISRSDASIEIWNLANIPFMERRIASSTDNFSVEGLTWCNKRLFSVGLHGLLIEYDLLKLQVKSTSLITGEAAFCLDANRAGTELAIGTEPGYLNIFTVTEDEVLFNKFLDKQEGRILCIKYDYSGEYLVTGSMDAIRIWNVNSGHALHKMTTGRLVAQKPTIVWCLAVTPDFTIISGDSRGKVSFWDGKLGSQIDSYQSHGADVLSVCVSNDGKSLYCSGIDPTIHKYELITVSEGATKWTRSRQRKVHDHDIRAMVLSGEKLFTSGVDGYLSCSYGSPKTTLKYPPILDNPCVQICSNSRQVMLRYSDSLEIWTLGSTKQEKDPRSGSFLLEEKPKKLVQLQKVVKNDDGQEENEGIGCSTMSDDGKYVLYSTRLGMRLFRLSFNSMMPELTPIEFLDGLGEIPCHRAIFTTNNQLVVTPIAGGLHIFTLDNDTPFLSQKINTDTEMADLITLLTTCPSGKHLIAGDCQGNIIVWKLINNEYKFYWKLPKYNTSPTAMAIHPSSLNVVVTYSNNYIVEYDLTEKKLTKFSRSFIKKSPEEWMSRTCVIRNITFDPRAEHIIILHDDSNIIIIDKAKKMPAKDVKIPRLESTEVSADGGDKLRTYEHAFHYIKKYKHLVHLSWLSDDEMVAVEVSPLHLIEQLPPCFVTNTFGKK